MINIEDLFISQPALCAIASIDEFRGRWQGRGGIDETLAARLKERALNESVAAIANPAENRNYRQLLEQIVNHSGETGLFETSVKKLHKLLLADSLIDEREKGEYKQRLNPVYSKTVDGRPIDVFFETASPFETPQMMHKLLEWTRNCLESRNCHPLPVIALFMVHFLIIHPFQDGQQPAGARPHPAAAAENRLRLSAVCLVGSGDRRQQGRILPLPAAGAEQSGRCGTAIRRMVVVFPAHRSAAAKTAGRTNGICGRQL